MIAWNAKAENRSEQEPLSQASSSAVRTIGAQQPQRASAAAISRATMATWVIERGLHPTFGRSCRESHRSGTTTQRSLLKMPWICCVFCAMDCWS